MTRVLAGDHVFVRRPLGYTHHGIACGDGTVIHYSGEPGRPGAVLRSSLLQFVGDGPVRVRRYRRRLSPRVTVERARSRLGEQSYDLVFNNCEHFAEWAATGHARSLQVESVGDALADVAQLVLPGSSAIVSPTLRTLARTPTAPRVSRI